MLGGTVHVRCAFDFDKIARLIGSKIGKQVYLPYLLDNRRVKLYIRFSCSHSIKSPPEIEITEGLSVDENLSAMYKNSIKFKLLLAEKLQLRIIIPL